MTISSRALCETNLLIYFIMNKGIPIHARASVSMLFRFYKTLSGYLDTRPIVKMVILTLRIVIIGQ